MTALFERRVASEWQLLRQLADENPGRIAAMRNDGAVFRFELHGPATDPADAAMHPGLVNTLSIHVEFPVHFPAVTMEMFLAVPVFHPNVHPETGFVCLWDRHRVSNTVEHALHRIVAMLAGTLRNTEPLHVMQPRAVEGKVQTRPMPLQGVRYELPVAPSGRRRRLE